MFLKPFKIKTNHQLKTSDKKQLKEELKQNFPRLAEGNLNELCSKKENISALKIETANTNTVLVYVVNKLPMVFVYDKIMFPTIFFLWKYPENVLCFTTYDVVISKIVDGAHLMLPGVVYPNISLFSKNCPAFSANTQVYINSTKNKAAVAVGVTAESSESLIRSHNRGKCVTVYHFLGDKLCTLENITCPPLPKLGIPDWLHVELDSTESDETQNTIDNQDTLENVQPEENIHSPNSSIQQMDDLFLYCFLAAVKYSTDLSVPILASTFYKVHLKKSCPSDQTLDVKKTFYKKLSVFLDYLKQIELLELEEEKKGVITITKFNHSHPKITEFLLKPEDQPIGNSKETDTPQFSITECHTVTAAVLPIFGTFGFTKGSIIANNDVRKYVTEYVKLHNIGDKNNIKLNDLLKIYYKHGDSIGWQDFIKKTYNLMSPCFKLMCGENVIIRKGMLEAIQITVAKRCGNKKVTLVDNLETFGINITDFATFCQRVVAASTSINRSQTPKKTDQFQLQGNQVLLVYDLLIDKYKMPKRYVTGLEFAPKRKH